MFNRLLRELNELSRKNEISIPISSDDEGYLDRECPAEACMFVFKVLGEDWRDVVRDDEVFCPMCRHAAPANSWYTTAQIESARKHALGQIQNRLGQAMREDARAWNERQRPGFISITMDVRGPVRSIPIPVAAGEAMRLKEACEACGCRYSYIGSAFFCPACGHNSAARTFAQTVSSVRTVTRLANQLRSSFPPDEAEMTARALREKGVGDVVTALQRLSERIWEKLPGTKPPPRNAFQRPDDASKLWFGATGRDFTAFLSEQELLRLRIGYQRRHLLAHCDGIVDEEYVRKSGDKTFSAGQRITITEAFLIDFVDLAEKLGSGLASSINLEITPVETQGSDDTDIDDGIAAATEGVLDLKSGYSAGAEAIARLLVVKSEYGLAGDPQLSAEVIRSATTLTDDDIAEAAHELESGGLAIRHQSLGMGDIGFYVLSAATSLFEVFDPLLGIGDPASDARTLAEILVNGDEQAGDTVALAEQVGWTPRRANPALDWLIARDLVLASGENDPVWTTRWVRRKPGLRNFVRSAGGSASR